MTDISSGVHVKLTEAEFLQNLANSDTDEAEPTIRSTLKWIDPALELESISQKARGVVREIELQWSHLPSGTKGREHLVLPESLV